MAPFAEFRGASLATVGWLISSYGLTQFILRLPIGAWSDRLGRRRPFVAVGFIVGIIGILGMALVPSPVAMVFFRGLTGVHASTWTVLTVLYAAHFPATALGRAMGSIMMATSLTQLVANLVGGLLAEWGGWEAPFWAGALVGLGGLLLVPRLREPPIEEEPPELRQLLAMGRDRHLLTVSVLAALCQSIAHVTLYGFTPVYASHLGASKLQLGVLAFVGTGTLAVASWFSGQPIAARWGSRKVLLMGFLAASVCSLAFPAARGIPPLVALQVGVSFGTGLMLPTLMALSIQGVSPERRATAMGFFQAMYALGMFAGPLLGGAVGQTWGVAAVFPAVAVLGAAGAAATYAFLTPLPRTSPPSYGRSAS